MIGEGFSLMLAMAGQREQDKQRELLRRAEISLRWLVLDCKARFDECRGNLEDGSKGGYSPELTAAMKALDELGDCT